MNKLNKSEYVVFKFTPDLTLLVSGEFSIQNHRLPIYKRDTLGLKQQSVIVWLDVAFNNYYADGPVFLLEATCYSHFFHEVIYFYQISQILQYLQVQLVHHNDTVLHIIKLMKTEVNYFVSCWSSNNM